MGVNDSCDECGPNRPPRLQKPPASAGTWNVDTEKGLDGVVMSTMKVRCRTSWHWLKIDSDTSITKSRTRASLFDAQSAIGRPSSGNDVWSPHAGDMSSRPISG